MEIGACRCLSSSVVPLLGELGPFLCKSKRHHGSEGLRTMHVFLRKMTRHKKTKKSVFGLHEDSNLIWLNLILFSF
jgi:hypothetical protein